MLLSQNFSSQKFEEKARFLAALGDVTTLRVLKILFSKQKICVSDIAKASNNSVSTISHQLAKLRNLDLVKSERRGREICYYLQNNDKLKLIKQIV